MPGTTSTSLSPTILTGPTAPPVVVIPGAVVSSVLSTEEKKYRNKMIGYGVLVGIVLGILLMLIFRGIFKRS